MEHPNHAMTSRNAARLAYLAHIRREHTYRAQFGGRSARFMAYRADLEITLCAFRITGGCAGPAFNSTASGRIAARWNVVTAARSAWLISSAKPIPCVGDMPPPARPPGRLPAVHPGLAAATR